MAQLTQLKLVVTISPGYSGEQYAAYMGTAGLGSTPDADLLAPAYYVSTNHPNPPPSYYAFWDRYTLTDSWSGANNPFEIIATAPAGLVTGDILTFYSDGGAGSYASEEIEVYGVYDDSSEVLFGSGNTTELGSGGGNYTEIELTVPPALSEFWTNFVTTAERDL